MRFRRTLQIGALCTFIGSGPTACGIFDHDPLPPQGQIVLGVATDAWLPRGAGEPFEALERNALFERLRIELFAPGESTPCDECFRDFGVDHRTLDEGRASIGFVPKPGVSGYRARVTLYHSGASESAAEPRNASSIVAVVALPVVSDDGIIDVHVTLRTGDVSRPRGTLDAPAAAEDGPAPAGIAGTWHEELVRGCKQPAQAGEACVPGGAYWMGDPGFDDPYERLVGLSPFYLDLHEATVADVRASGLAFVDRANLKADPYLHSDDLTKNIAWCTYTESAGALEALVVTCVSRDLATKICKARGRVLPSEAQYEFVAGARRDASFPWGEATPSCTDAVFGRDYESTTPPAYRMCRGSGEGAAKPGSGALDRLAMPDGNVIVDLAGNVSEWTSDEYQESTEPCSLVNPALDPVCREPSKVLPARVSVRGSPWTDPGGPFLRAAVKQSAAASVPQNPRIGFRCARPAE